MVCKVIPPSLRSGLPQENAARIKKTGIADKIFFIFILNFLQNGISAKKPNRKCLINYDNIFKESIEHRTAKMKGSKQKSILREIAHLGKESLIYVLDIVSCFFEFLINYVLHTSSVCQYFWHFLKNDKRSKI